MKWEEIDFEDYEDEAATDVLVENAHVASHMLDKKLEAGQDCDPEEVDWLPKRGHEDRLRSPCSVPPLGGLGAGVSEEQLAELWCLKWEECSAASYEDDEGVLPQQVGAREIGGVWKSLYPLQIQMLGTSSSPQ